MPSHSYDLFGHDTFEVLYLGGGTRYREQWGLMDHPGTQVNWQWIGGPTSKYIYLYPEHLSLLYDRFRRSNPTGATIEVDGSFEVKFRPRDISDAELDALYEGRRLFVSLTFTDEDKGYPHLRKYLPEIFDPVMVAQMGADPWLDQTMLSAAVMSGDVPGKFEDVIQRHPRWSTEWKSYCDRARKT